MEHQSEATEGVDFSSSHGGSSPPTQQPSRSPLFSAALSTLFGSDDSSIEDPFPQAPGVAATVSPDGFVQVDADQTPSSPKPYKQNLPDADAEGVDDGAVTMDQLVALARQLYMVDGTWKEPESESEEQMIKLLREAVLAMEQCMLVCLSCMSAVRATHHVSLACCNQRWSTDTSLHLTRCVVMASTHCVVLMEDAGCGIRACY